MSLATTMPAPSQVMPPGLATAPTYGPTHHIPRCPRPDCGGQILAVDVALDEVAAICMLCARSVPVDGGDAASGRGGVL